jgi:hypothetical protein
VSAILKKSELVRNFFTQLPEATIDECVRTTNVSRRTIVYIRKEMVEEGLLKPGRRTKLERPIPEELPQKQIDSDAKIPIVSGMLLDGETLRNLAKNDDFEEEITDDQDTQRKLLKEVRKLALGAGVHPDTRLSAIQVWAKLKDIAKAKDIGPGLPKTEEDIIFRLVRIMQGVGPTLVLKAIEQAFERINPDDKAPDQQSPAIIGVTETPGPAEYEDSPA